MKALKDAGIVLIALTLLISTRVHKIDPAESLETGPLMTQTEATEAAPASPTEDPSPIHNARVVMTPMEPRIEIDQDTAMRWVVSLPEADARAIQLDAADRCSEILVLIRRAAEATGRDAVTREVDKVIQAAPCPRA